MRPRANRDRSSDANQFAKSFTKDCAWLNGERNETEVMLEGTTTDERFCRIRFIRNPDSASVASLTDSVFNAQLEQSLQLQYQSAGVTINAKYR